MTGNRKDNDIETLLFQLKDMELIYYSNLKLTEKIRCFYELCSKEMKPYIRFGEIPKDEMSARGNGIIGDGYKVIGYEDGVSVWNCVYDFRARRVPILFKNKKNPNDFYTIKY